MTDEQEIEAILERVTESFSNLDLVAWSNCFHPARLIVTPKGTRSPTTQAECEQVMKSTVEFLQSRNFVKSVLDYYQIHLLSDYSAVVSTVWSRFDKDDKLIHRFGTTYFFTKEHGRWAISLLTSHSADKKIAAV